MRSETELSTTHLVISIMDNLISDWGLEKFFYADLNLRLNNIYTTFLAILGGILTGYRILYFDKGVRTQADMINMHKSHRNDIFPAVSA